MAKKNNVPLPSGFMFSSIIGIMVSILFVWKQNITWGFTFTLVFVLMFISSIISMTRAKADDKYHLSELAIHDQIHKRKKKKIIRK